MYRVQVQFAALPAMRTHGCFHPVWMPLPRADLGKDATTRPWIWRTLWPHSVVATGTAFLDPEKRVRFNPPLLQKLQDSHPVCVHLSCLLPHPAFQMSYSWSLSWGLGGRLGCSQMFSALVDLSPMRLLPLPWLSYPCQGIISTEAALVPLPENLLPWRLSHWAAFIESFPKQSP